MNSVLCFRHRPENYDRATDLELLGGRMIDLDRRQWHEIAEAA